MKKLLTPFMLSIVAIMLLPLSVIAKTNMGTITLSIGETRTVYSEESTYYTVSGTWSQTGNAFSRSLVTQRSCKITGVSKGTSTLEWAGSSSGGGNTYYEEMYWTVNVVEPVLDRFRYQNVQYKVISNSDKTCMVGAGSADDDNLAVPKTYSGSLTIPEYANGYKVIEVARCAFCKCEKITSIKLPSSITSIGMNAIQGCKGIKSITIPDAVIEIPDYAISLCDNLEEVTIGTGIKKIGSYVFWNDTKLKSITLLATEPPTISSDAFYNIDITNITLYVPAPSFSKYKEASLWSKFGKIEKIGGTPDGIDINETNFPDVKFRDYLFSEDYGKDGVITESEISIIKSINVYSMGIVSLKGIEYFTELEQLHCHYNQLTSLDVSKNTALTRLYCNNNQLTSLDVSRNTNLTSLLCENNQLTSLDVSKNAALTTLWCDNNRLKSLDVSKNVALTSLECYDNQLTFLDVSRNTNLTSLSCGKNQLTSLDVSSITNLTYLACYNNQLTSLDVSKNEALTSLYCLNNQLKSLDVSRNTNLTLLSCGNNQLTSLDVSKNAALTSLYCHTNQLTSLNVSDNTKLTYLNCRNNQIRGKAMDDLIASLPMNNSDELYEFSVIDSRVADQNVCTKNQVAAAKAKGWLPLYYNGSESLEYEGSNPYVVTKGDLTGDGNVSITDVVMIIDVIAGIITDVNQIEAADVNNDGSVTITDCVAAIDLIAAQQYNGARMAETLVIPATTDFISASLQNNLMTVNLDNKKHYTAFQMMISLPEGMTLGRAAIDVVRGADHQLVVRSLGNSQYLLAGFSMGNAEIVGESGRLFTIATKGQALGDIVFNNVEFATTKADACRLGDIVLSGNTTGVELVENGEWGKDDSIFDLQGRRVNQPTRGLYIVNGKKINYK